MVFICNYKVTRECIDILYQRKSKSNVPKISIIFHNNVFFLTIFFLYLGFLTESKELCKVMHLNLCYLASVLIVISPLKFPSNFTLLQKCLTNDFFNLETITSYN